MSQPAAAGHCDSISASSVGLERDSPVAASQNRQSLPKEPQETGSQQTPAKMWAKRPVKIHASARSRAIQTGENARAVLAVAANSSNPNDIRQDRWRASPRSVHHAALL